MKAIKLLSLAAVAVLATVALLGVGTASATQLCKTAEDPCEVENLYAEGTTVEASTKEAVFETSLTNITCASEAKGETTAAAGSPLPLILNAVTFTSCKGKASSCTVKALEPPFYAQIETTGENAGGMELFGDVSTGLTFSINCE